MWKRPGCGPKAAAGSSRGRWRSSGAELFTSPSPPSPIRGTRFRRVENPARHRAFGDALATAHVLRALVGRARERGVETLEQLIELHDRPRHAKTRKAEPGTRNIIECLQGRTTFPDSSAFRVPPSDF